MGVNGGTPRLIIDGGVTSTPAIAVDGKIYIGTMSGLVALEVELGERWRFEVCASPARGTSANAQERCIDRPIGPVFISPAVTAGDEVVLIASSGCVFAVKDEETGLPTCRWAATAAAGGCEPSEERGCAGASPQVLIDSRDFTLVTVFVGTRDGELRALNGNGTLRWRFPSDGGSLGGALTSTPAIGLDAIYVTTPAGILHALDGAGRPLWGVPILLESDDLGLQPSPATVTAVYLPNAAGEAVAYNADGSVKWRFSTEADARVVGSIGIASQLLQEPESTSGTFEPVAYVLDENGIVYGLRDSSGLVVELPRCSLSNDTCTIDTCTADGEGTCVDGICSMSTNSCTPQSCTEGNGTCVVKSGRVIVAPEGSEVSTSPSISGDLFAVVGTQDGGVCARRLDDQIPDAWPANGCVDVGIGQPVADSPVVDSRGRVFIVSNSSLYAIE